MIKNIKYILILILIGSNGYTLSSPSNFGYNQVYQDTNNTDIKFVAIPSSIFAGMVLLMVGAGVYGTWYRKPIVNLNSNPTTNENPTTNDTAQDLLVISEQNPLTELKIKFSFFKPDENFYIDRIFGDIFVNDIPVGQFGKEGNGISLYELIDKIKQYKSNDINFDYQQIANTYSAVNKKFEANKNLAIVKNNKILHHELHFKVDREKKLKLQIEEYNTHLM